ncbi:mercury transporter [Flavobacterium seoulense]|uniref:Mercury transporter n=2 Tax=Flavobacterium seoulense TaxID=1492738 RepID=A0A066X1X4_9FLAO|nr:mercury transporter [Flavobacterium seoulense]
MIAVVLLSTISITAQIKNEKTETVKILGNCSMCKKTIETAGNIKNVAVVNWDTKTKMATLKYDASKINSDDILKKIAAAGYENEKFTADETQYNKLHACCQYDRDVVSPTKKAVKK